jgi:hypothetical protein
MIHILKSGSLLNRNLDRGLFELFGPLGYITQYTP